MSISLPISPNKFVVNNVEIEYIPNMIPRDYLDQFGNIRASKGNKHKTYHLADILVERGFDSLDDVNAWIASQFDV